MDMRFTASIGAVLVGTGMMLAPVAHANPDWVAVAGDDDENHIHWSWGGGLSRAAMESRAVGNCVNTGGGHCHLLASGTPCLAVVEDAAHWHWGTGGSASVATDAAYAAAAPGAGFDGVHCIWD
jgi:hypothetical protein